MPELNTVAAEFVAVTSYCIKEKIGYYIKGNSFLAIDRAVLEGLLDRNKYETSAEKLARWKRLHWIDSDADNKHIMKSVYIKEESKSRRMIVINLTVHGELLKLCCGNESDNNNRFSGGETNREHSRKNHHRK